MRRYATSGARRVVDLHVETGGQGHRCRAEAGTSESPLIGPERFGKHLMGAAVEILPVLGFSETGGNGPGFGMVLTEVGLRTRREGVWIDDVGARRHDEDSGHVAICLRARIGGEHL